MTDKYEWEFKSVPDIFIFEKLEIDETQEIPRQPNFGILDRDYPTEYKQPLEGPKKQWPLLVDYVEHLNATSDANVSYKLVFVLRHGVGVHNVVMKALSAAEKRGDVTEEKIWNKKYSHLDGAEPGEVYVKIVDDQPDDQNVDQENKNDEPSLPRSSLSADGKIEWVDAPLVAKGITQARKLAGLWKKAVEDDGMPWPQSIYTSPMARCLETTRLVFKDIVEPEDQTTAIVPVVKEAARERMTNHTCDKRRSLSWIKEKYPEYKIEEGFAEDDTFWTPDVKFMEKVGPHVERKKALLEDIFEHDNNQVISLTAHSFALTAILLAVGAKKFRISECTMVPILIRAEKKKKVDAVTPTTPAPEEVPAAGPETVRATDA